MRGKASFPGPVDAQDVRTVVDAAVTALSAATDAEWSACAGDLEWDCWETVEHLADDLMSYAVRLGPAPAQRHVPFEVASRYPGGVQTTSPTVRAYHPYGLCDPQGFTVMGVLETLVHTHDVAGP